MHKYRTHTRICLLIHLRNPAYRTDFQQRKVSFENCMYIHSPLYMLIIHLDIQDSESEM